jgi:tetratricopeptide (TPR) repeat protein
MYRKTLIPIILTAAIIAGFTGCDSYKTTKQKAKDRWQLASAKAQVPVARDLMQRGELDEAHKTLRQCLSVNPDSPEANQLMGQLLFAKGLYVDSARHFQKTLELTPRSHRAWYYLGVLAEQDSDYHNAVDCYKKAIDIQPAEPEYIIALAQCYAIQDKHEAALNLLKSKIESFPTAIKLKAEAADIMLRQGRTKEAISMYQKALYRAPDNTMIQEALGYAFIVDKQWENAAGTFSSLAESTEPPQNETYLQMAAMCSLNCDKYSMAIGALDKLSVNRRDDPEVWLKMGQAALGTNSPNRAFACAKRALQLQPGWTRAVLLQGCAEYLMRDYSKAFETFRDVTSQDPDNDLAWFLAGRCAQYLGNSRNAQMAFERLEKINPDSELLGLIHASNN